MSPSGIHLGHYHALIARHCHKDLPNSPEWELLDAQQEALIYAHVSMINYAVRMGILSRAKRAYELGGARKRARNT